MNERCPECNGNLIRMEHETVCDSCGLVLDDLMLDGSSSFGFNTVTDIRTSGKGLGGAGITVFKGLRYNAVNMNNRMSSEDYRRAEQFREIDRKASLLGLDDVRIRKEAMDIVDRSDVKGVGDDVRAAAALYLASRMRGTPRSMSGIAHEFGLDVNDICEVYLRMAKTLRGNYTESNNRGRGVHLIDPKSYVDRYAQKLGMEDQRNEVRMLVDYAMTNIYGSASVKPESVTAAALYIISEKLGLGKTRQDICQATYTSPSTLQKRVSELRKYLYNSKAM